MCKLFGNIDTARRISIPPALLSTALYPWRCFSSSRPCLSSVLWRRQVTWAMCVLEWVILTLAILLEDSRPDSVDPGLCVLNPISLPNRAPRTSSSLSPNITRSLKITTETAVG